MTAIADGVRDRDLIVEAATENPELKRKIFTEMDTHAPRSGHSRGKCILHFHYLDLTSATKRPDPGDRYAFYESVPRPLKLVRE